METEHGLVRYWLPLGALICMPPASAAAVAGVILFFT